MPRPHPTRPRAHKPSPLATVTLPGQRMSMLTTKGDMSIVKDPMFWKRFSTAVHQAEAYDQEMGYVETPSSADSAASSTASLFAAKSRERERNERNERNDWLASQKAKSRRTRCYCLLILAILCILGVAAGVLAWYLPKVIHPGEPDSN